MVVFNHWFYPSHPSPSSSCFNLPIQRVSSSWTPLWEWARIHHIGKRYNIWKGSELIYPISPQLWPWLSVITGDFYGIIHSINGVSSVLITGKGPYFSIYICSLLCKGQEGLFDTFAMHCEEQPLMDWWSNKPKTQCQRSSTWWKTFGRASRSMAW